jgi:hypothetical protein
VCSINQLTAVKDDEPPPLLPPAQSEQQQQPPPRVAPAQPSPTLLPYPLPQAATAKIFAPRTEDMSKGFLTFSDDEPGLTCELIFYFVGVEISMKRHILGN